MLYDFNVLAEESAATKYEALEFVPLEMGFLAAGGVDRRVRVSS